MRCVEARSRHRRGAAYPGGLHHARCAGCAVRGVRRRRSRLHGRRRGILYHRYVVDEEGDIVAAKITPPTAQNQATIEADLRAFVEPRAQLPLNELTWQCEQAIRNYDPCISCLDAFLASEDRKSIATKSQRREGARRRDWRF